MAHHVTETIWHFCGYFHIADLLGYDPVHYLGAPDYEMSGYGRAPGSPRDAGPQVDLPDKSLPVALPAVAVPLQSSPLVGGRPEAAEFAPSNMAVPALVAPQLPSLLKPQAPGDFGGAFTTFPVPAEVEEITITLRYTDISGYLSNLNVIQANVMLDADTLFGDPQQVLNATALPADTATALNDMIADAEAVIPSLKDIIDPSRLQSSQYVTDGDPAPIDTSGRASAAPAMVPENSQYVNGAEAADSGNPPDANAVIKASMKDINDAIEAFNPDLETPQEQQPVILEDGRETIHVVTDATPTGGYAQKIVTGANEALNIAIVDDRTDGQASLIIEGDYHETNAIIQVNVLTDNDAVKVSGDMLAQVIATQDNSLVNDATFVIDPGTLAGDGINGFSGATDWNVTYVTGDYWDITSFTQRNVLLDGDLAEQTSANTHFITVLGSDGQLNFVEFAGASAGYDLIIIGGSYYDLNAIVQVNLLLDSDVVTQMLGGPGSQTIEAGGNLLTNEAAIVSMGSEDFKPLTGDPARLAEAVGDHQEIVAAEMSLGIPGNGTDTLNVLYVTGDFYDLDLLVQTNIVLDADSVAQTALHGAQENGTEAGADLTQAAATGANQLTNLALIVDVDSLSGYQYLGGEEYETTLLVQANIIEDDDDVDVNNLHPDVVAVLAGMADTEADAAPCSNADEHSYSHSTGDVLGSVMS